MDDDAPSGTDITHVKLLNRPHAALTRKLMVLYRGEAAFGYHHFLSQPCCHQNGGNDGVFLHYYRTCITGGVPQLAA